MNLEQDEKDKKEEITEEASIETVDETTETPSALKEEEPGEVRPELASEPEAVEAEIETEENPEEEVITADTESEPVESVEEVSVEDHSDVVDSEAFYQKILNKIEEVLESNDWGLISNEFANLSLHISEGPEPDENSQVLLNKYEELRTDFEERKKAHYEELNQKKEENLKKKKELLKQFADIVNEEKWTATKEVAQIRGSWDRITLIPRDEVDTLNERFDSFLKEFESHKVERLVKKLQKEEENLTLKLLLLDKMETLNASSDKEDLDFEALNKDFEDLLAQWRKIGRVPNEKNQDTWDRFNKAQDTFNELRFKNDKEYRKRVENSLKKKKKLIAEAEALVDEENIATAAQRVNNLHKAWKKTGNLPQKDENELWDKFKAATDAFNEKKSENIDVLREQEQKNYERKVVLINKAVELGSEDDFEKGHQEMQKLMDEWKKVGPVPRKKSSKAWKSFKEAMDAFYDRRREHFKDRRGAEKENYTAKKEIIEKIMALADHEDPAKAVEETKKLQAEFKKAGHVPIKVKNKVWKQYREACDVVYNRFRSLGSDLGMERKLASQGIEPGDRKQAIQLQKEQSALKKDISKLEAESIQYEEAKTYFKPTNKGNKLRDELQEKIDNTAKKLNEKQSRLKEINIELKSLMARSDEEE